MRSHRNTDLINQLTTKDNPPVKSPHKSQHPKESAAQVTTTTTEIDGELLCYSTIHNPTPDIEAMKATSDPDTMYMHQAMKEKDKEFFKQAMKKEWKDQIENGNFILRHINEIPPNATILPAVWQMKQKRCIKTRQVKKYKARLNIDGSKMRPGVHYDQMRSYAPVASRNSIRLLLTLCALNNWHTTQIDYVLAFPQAPVERTIYMKIPKGYQMENADTSKYVLEIKRNIYGQVQAGRVWNDYLTDKLVHKLGFKQSQTDKCMFYRGKTIYLLYTDDSILAGPDQQEIDKIIREIRSIGLNITVEGNIQDFLGINITRKEDGSIHMHQPHLIDDIIKDLRLDNERVKVKDIPMASSRLLSYHSDSPSFDNHFDYRSLIGKLLYLFNH